MSQRIEQAALAYAEKFGWKVLPVTTIKKGHCSCGKADCDAKGKHPRLAEWQKKASVDRPTIHGWWRRWPGANIGVATGAASGFFVLDIDGEAGEESLRDLEDEHGPLPPTVEQLTGGGGRHILFKHPGYSVGNKVALAPGVDVRGDGGYIVVAPSIHASGRRYEWEASSRPGEIPLADAPRWLLDKLMQPQASSGKAKVDPLQVLAGVAEGERDDKIFRYACQLRQKGLAKEEAIHLVLKAAKACKPPFPENEALAKTDSAWRYERTENYHLTDYGNAQRLVAQYGQDLRHCHPWKVWLLYNSHQWCIDETSGIMRFAKNTACNMLAEAAHINDDKERRDFLKFVLKTEQKDRLTAMVALAASEPGIPVLPSDLDKTPWLLNCANGTIDLRTGNLRPHRREDLLTKIIQIKFDQSAECLRWKAFLEQIMDGNQNLINFLQRAAGMSLTGDVSEHVLLILYGTGRNGKSTFLNTLLTVVGDYGMIAPPDLLIAKQNDRHPAELADLFGKRFVTSVESDQGRRFAEALIKQLTGGDPIKARRMRENFWQFMPTHKLWMATNHRPKVRGTDVAIWSRLKLIPFNVRFPDGDPRQDKKLPEKLREELPGILRWCVEGCLSWQKEGLGVPEEVTTATETYRQEQDILAAFMSDCCIVNPLAKAPVKELYAEYVKWCEETKERPLKKNDFRLALIERGFHSDKSSGGSRFWFGIGLLEYHGGGVGGVGGVKTGITTLREKGARLYRESDHWTPPTPPNRPNADAEEVEPY